MIWWSQGNEKKRRRSKHPGNLHKKQRSSRTFHETQRHSFTTAQWKYIHDLRTTSDYLEMAADICASNVSFIGMFEANSFCKEQYISPATLGFEKDSRYSIWNRFHDHQFCQCLTGDYRARNCYIRFYYRCPGTVIMPLYCRQLVYGADNVLRQGFGDAEPIEL